MAQDVFPEQFFSVRHPSSIFTQVQFRTGVDTSNGIENGWGNDITQYPNMHFESMDIVDNAGVRNLTLTLVDPLFYRLEGLIAKCMLRQRIGNKLAGQPITETNNYLQFRVDSESLINLRIRFGYTDKKEGNHIDAERFSDGNYIQRVENGNTVLRSPYLYFQIMNVSYETSTRGLKCVIQGIGTGGSVLQRAKLIRQNATIRGTPIHVIESFAGILDEVTQGTIKIQIPTNQNAPKAYTIVQENGETEDAEISLSLGGEPSRDRFGGYTSGSFMTMEQILTALVSSIAPKLVHKETGEVIPYQQGIEENDLFDMYMYRYTYSVETKEDATYINFYYMDPQESMERQAVRVYEWFLHEKTIVHNVQIKNDGFFAAINLPTVIRGQNGIYIYNATSVQAVQAEEYDNSFEGNDEEREYSLTEEGREYLQNNVLSAPDDKTALLEDIQFENGLVFQDMETSSTGDNAAREIMNRFVSNVNQMVFSGTMQIAGDPFFLFDNVLKPFVYIIKLQMNRPAIVGDRAPNIHMTPYTSSFMSGKYVIKKITHSITAGIFRTTLEISMYPTND